MSHLRLCKHSDIKPIGSLVLKPGEFLSQKYWSGGTDVCHGVIISVDNISCTSYILWNRVPEPFDFKVNVFDIHSGGPRVLDISFTARPTHVIRNKTYSR